MNGQIGFSILIFYNIIKTEPFSLIAFNVLFRNYLRVACQIMQVPSSQLICNKASCWFCTVSRSVLQSMGLKNKGKICSIDECHSSKGMTPLVIYSLKCVFNMSIGVLQLNLCVVPSYNKVTTKNFQSYIINDNVCVSM